MRKDERVLALFEGKSVDYLPSQITFASKSRDARIAQELSMAEEDLPTYLENHIRFTYAKADHPLFFKNDIAMMDELENEGYCKVDSVNGIVYDDWGLGHLRGEQGAFICYGPMREDAKKREMARPYMPERLKGILDLPLEEAVKAYTAPDPLHAGNLDPFEYDIKNNRDNLLLIPSGYSGIFERAYETIGFQDFMIALYEYPDELMELMEKITDYKVALIKEKARLGFRVFHHGDDMGTQQGGLFSESMFKEMILPHIKRLYAEAKKYGMYVVQHSCGNIMQYLPALIDAGLDGLEPIQPCMDLKTIKREFGKDLVLWGGIDTQYLPFMSPAEVEKMVRETVSILGKGGRYIIAPSQEVMDDVPLENVVALVKTIQDMRADVM